MNSSEAPGARRPAFRPAPAMDQFGDSSGAEVAVPPRRWAAMLADLADRGIATDGVELVGAREVTWRNGSWGCPQPGRSYTQALVDGMQVIVRAGGRQYDYRFGRSDTPRLCRATADPS